MNTIKKKMLTIITALTTTKDKKVIDSIIIYETDDCFIKKIYSTIF